MAGETTIVVVGNLVSDPDLKFTPSGAACCRFTVASTPRVFDKASNSYKDGQALFMNCTAWREMAESIAEGLQRGMRVIVSGRLRQRSYDDREGNKRTVVEMEADEVGPSMKWATVTVQKMSRGSSGGQPGGGTAPRGGGEQDPWASSGSSFDEAPPF